MHPIMAKKNQNNSDDLRQESDEDLDDVVDSVIGVDEKEKTHNKIHRMSRQSRNYLQTPQKWL